MQSPSLASSCKLNCLHIHLLQRIAYASSIQIQMIQFDSQIVIGRSIYMAHGGSQELLSY